VVGGDEESDGCRGAELHDKGGGSETAGGMGDGGLGSEII